MRESERDSDAQVKTVRYELVSGHWLVRLSPLTMHILVVTVLKPSIM